MKTLPVSTLSVAVVLAVISSLPVAAQFVAPKPPLPTSSPLKVTPRPAPARPVAVAATQPGSAPLAAPAAPARVSPTVTLPAIPSPLAATTIAPTAAGDITLIKWDSETKEYSAKPGEAESRFTFWLTNTSPSEISVNSVRTSCGCTTAKLPPMPWKIASGSNGPIEVVMNLAGKSGMIAKGVTIDTSLGIKQLTVRTHIPGATAPGALPVQNSGIMGDTERLKNMQLALADRQVVFKNADCAKCHAEPAKGKTDGRLLYAAVCATCHNSHHRAAQVPDLRTLPHPTNAEHWRKWIAYGRAGSMMPAFAESEGGPLNEQQINSLVDFMVKAFPSRPQALPAQRPASSPAAAPGAAAPAAPVAPRAY